MSSIVVPSSVYTEVVTSDVPVTSFVKVEKLTSSCVELLTSVEEMSDEVVEASNHDDVVPVSSSVLTSSYAVLPVNQSVLNVFEVQSDVPVSSDVTGLSVDVIMSKNH